MTNLEQEKIMLESGIITIEDAKEMVKDDELSQEALNICAPEMMVREAIIALR